MPPPSPEVLLHAWEQEVDPSRKRGLRVALEELYGLTPPLDATETCRLCGQTGVYCRCADPQ